MRRSPSTSCPCYSSQVRNGQLSQHRVALESLEVACPMSRWPTSFSTQHLFFPFVQLSSPARCCPFEKEGVFTCFIIIDKCDMNQSCDQMQIDYIDWKRLKMLMLMKSRRAMKQLQHQQGVRAPRERERQRGHWGTSGDIWWPFKGQVEPSSGSCVICSLV